ncbi:hydrolases of the alpha/beta superfamily [Lachnospiraceae bacterium KM106-2]|nr:hydrolases of the alpha/beta superfamily [Lachnospiraceae bacterium KM106-2]
MIIISIILFIFLALMFLISYILLRKTSHPKFFTTEETIEIEKGKGYLTNYFDLPKEDYTISSYDGYELHCTYIPAASDQQKVIIVTHGHTYSKWGSVKYLMLFRDLGYHAIIYDDRGHGDNQPAPITMGYKEQKDLMCVIEDTRRRFGENCYIGLHGESMGSAISLQVLASHPPIHFVVSDCGYSDLIFFTKMFAHVNYHIPGLLIDLASILSRLLYGYWLSQVSPISTLSDNKIPICFIHGASDTFIDPCNAVRMYQADAGYKELHIFPNAGHAESYATAPEEYTKIVHDFINKVESEDGFNEYKKA